MWRAKFPLILVYGISLIGFYSSAALAQTIPDHTLGSESSTVNQNVTIGDRLVDLIESGATRGNNLFHSFSEFNLRDGSAVYFASPDGIANILTRVTGNNPSEILGTLGVDGAANLFLLNPNGIVFGENAALDVNGSFLATTADSYIFENGFEYSGNNPSSPPLLTVNIPVGLQFGSKSAGIVNKSQILNDAEEIVGLEIQPQENFTLVGGDISFAGGKINAQNSSIEIGSVAPNSFVEIVPTENNWTLDYAGINNFQDISLTQGAGIRTSGDGAGNINIQTNKLNVLEGSSIAAKNFGETDGGSLNINAQESINLAGTDADTSPSSISTDIYDSGKGANLTIQTGTLELKDGAYISADNHGTGDGGNLTISASDFVSLIGSEEVGFGHISTDVYNSGNAGNLTIETGSLEVKDKTFISSDVLIYGDVLDMGDGGNVTVKADDSVEVVGSNADQFDNSISSSVYLFTDTPLAELSLKPNSANGGNLRIETKNLRVANGGTVTTDNFGSGKAGSLTINASELVEVLGNSQEGIQSYVSTSVYGTSDGGDFTINTGTLRIVDDAFVDSITYAKGNGGTLTVNANQLIVKDGGQLGVGISGGEGNAGSLIVNATDFVEISGSTRILYAQQEGEVFFVNSGLFASANSPFSGNGGEILIQTPTLKLFDGGAITTSTNSAGNGGNISIRANTIEVSDFRQDTPGRLSGITSLVGKRGTGDGGNIDLAVNNLRLIDGGLISVNAFGNGDAGNIKINSQNINVSGVSSGKPVFGVEQESLPSSISAVSQGDFDAGSININTDTLQISDRGNISVSNLSNGNSGNLNITAKELNLDNSATLEAKVNAGSQGNINLTTDNIFLRNNSEITAEANGKATGGNIFIDNTANIVLLKNSKVIANADEGNGGNIEIMTQGYFVSKDSLVSASSEFGLDGNVDVETINGDRPIELDRLPENLVDGTQQIAKTCGGGTNQFAIVGRGGLPENPLQNLRGQTVWQDLRLTAIDSSKISQVQGYQSPTPILEAQAWKINDLGRIELIANNADARHLDNSSVCQ